MSDILKNISFGYIFHIIVLKNEWDQSNYSRPPDVRKGTGDNGSSFVKKGWFISLKFYFCKLDIDKFKFFSYICSKLKSDVDKLDFHNRKAIPTDRKNIIYTAYNGVVQKSLWQVSFTNLWYVNYNLWYVPRSLWINHNAILIKKCGTFLGNINKKIANTNDIDKKIYFNEKITDMNNKMANTTHWPILLELKTKYLILII